MEVNDADIHISLTGKPRESIKSRRWRYLKQALFVANASQWFIQMAMFGAWINPASYDFIKVGTNIYGVKMHFSDTELDMLGTLPCIGAILGCVYAWPVSWWGRRFSLRILVIPHIITWSILGFSPSPTWILGGKVMSGFCMGAASLTACTYMVEIPDVAIRGTISMLSQLEIAAGFLLTVTLGLVFRYYHYTYLGISLAVIACVLNHYIPESPTFLVTKNREEEARHILRRIRSPDDDIELELEMLRNENKGMEESSFISVLGQPANRKSLFILMGIFTIQQFSGIYVCYMYTTRIFIDAGTNMNENLAVVFTFIFQFLGTIAGSITIEGLGRRRSIIISLILVSMFLYIMGTYTYFHSNIDDESSIATAAISLTNSVGNTTHSSLVNTSISSSSFQSNEVTNEWQWVPLMCLMGIVFCASIGIESIPWILSAEYFPTSIRAKAQTIFVTINSILGVVVFGLYSPMKNTLTSAGLYFFYGTCSVVGFLFSLIFVRETAGQTIG